MRNTTALSILFLFYSITNFSQEKQTLEALKTDSTWTKEIIKFPIGFAQEIKYEGFEDLRFPQGWSKQESPNFWSYAWAWSLNDTKQLSESELETNIQYYFDGLLGLDPKYHKNVQLQTNAVFIKKESSNVNSNYVGKVKTFDTRYTNKPMTLYVLAEQYYCEQNNKTIIFFKFSPKEFENEVWQTLNEVKLHDDICNH